METLSTGLVVRSAVDMGVMALCAAAAICLLKRWPLLRALGARGLGVGLLAAAAVLALAHAASIAGMVEDADVVLYAHVLTLLPAAATTALLLRRLERKRRALAAARTARERFFAQISHELRTPLNSIIGFSQLSRSLLDMGLGEPAAFASYQADIERSADHLGRLIDDFADLAALESGRLALDLEPVDLTRKVHCCEKLLRAEAEAKGLAFRVESLAVTRFVRADSARLRQVLVNVLQNAILYTQRGQVTVFFIETPTTWGVCVHDTGSGIALPDLARVLRPLERGTESPHLAAAGAGIGLAIVDELMRAMRGRMEIESTPGRGTSVKLIWPKAYPAERASATPLPHSTALSEPAC